MAKATGTKLLNFKNPAASGTVFPLLTTVVIVSIMLLTPLMTALTEATDALTPVAVINGTLHVSAGGTVYLNGTSSFDPGGSDLIFTWTLVGQPESSFATMTDSNESQTSFDTDLPGTYRVRLVVNNGFVSSEPVYATVIASP